jgi:hypothetical protein
MDTSKIVATLDRIRALDCECRLFGAGDHGYRLNPPATDEVVRAFEIQHGLNLPADYRSFLMEIGNGGAGPSYGLLPLGSPGEYKYKTGDLGKPFPHSAAWNVPDGWFKSLPDPWGGRGDQLPRSWPSIEACLEAVSALPVDQDAKRRREELTSWYFASEHVNGAIALCHEGCGYYDLLVVRGPKYGTVWIDGRASDYGISPLLSPTGEVFSFETWYLNWLHECVAKCTNHCPS